MTTKRRLLSKPVLLAISGLAIGMPVAAVLAQSANGGFNPPYVACPINTTDSDCAADYPWSEARLAVVRNKIRNNVHIVSPRNFSERNKLQTLTWAYAQYNLKENVFISHRGLVDLHDGIAENTLAAVRNAVEDKIYVVEIDVQASRDKIPLALHDETVHRVLGLPDNQGGENKVSQYDAAGLIGKTVKIKGANQKFYDADSHYAYDGGSRYCGPVGNQIMSLGKLVQYMEAPPESAPDTCKPVSGMTYVWDPKNLESARATVNFATNSSYNNKFIMKVYPTFYTNSGAIAVIKTASQLKDSRRKFVTNSGTKFVTMKVMPVISTVRPALNLIAQETDPITREQKMQKTVEEAMAIVTDWSQYFEVQGVEIPGAWDVHWAEFAHRLQDRLEAFYGKKNDDSIYHHNAIGEVPVISVGYRFADFAEADGSPAYVWEMDGYAKLDTSTDVRRTLGGEYQWYQQSPGWTSSGRKLGYGVCSSIHQNGCFITTDFPMQEYGISLYPQTKANGKNNPQTNVANSIIPTATLKKTERTKDGDGLLVAMSNWLLSQFAAADDKEDQRRLEGTNPGSGGAPGFIWDGDGSCNLCNPDNGDG